MSTALRVTKTNDAGAKAARAVEILRRFGTPNRVVLWRGYMEIQFPTAFAQVSCGLIDVLDLYPDDPAVMSDPTYTPDPKHTPPSRITDASEFAKLYADVVESLGPDRVTGINSAFPELHFDCVVITLSKWGVAWRYPAADISSEFVRRGWRYTDGCLFRSTGR